MLDAAAPPSTSSTCSHELVLPPLEPGSYQIELLVFGQNWLTTESVEPAPAAGALPAEAAAVLFLEDPLAEPAGSTG
jgi:hypothetical protein